MTDWSPSSWRQRPASQQPTYPDPGGLDRSIGELSSLPPLVTSWEIERLKAPARGGRRGSPIPPSGRGLRRAFRPVLRRDHHQQAQGPPPDEPGADLRPQATDHPGRSVCRPVRQTEIIGHRDPRRRQPAVLPGRSRQRARLHRGGTHPRPRSPAPRIRDFGADPQLHQVAGRGWFCRSPSPRVLGSRFRRALTAGPRVPDDGGVDLGLHSIHGGPCRFQGRRDQQGRLLHQPRGSASALRSRR